jgi:hypothetical protein
MILVIFWKPRNRNLGSDFFLEDAQGQKRFRQRFNLETNQRRAIWWMSWSKLGDFWGFCTVLCAWINDGARHCRAFCVINESMITVDHFQNHLTTKRYFIILEFHGGVISSWIHLKFGTSRFRLGKWGGLSFSSVF